MISKYDTQNKHHPHPQFPHCRTPIFMTSSKPKNIVLVGAGHAHIQVLHALGEMPLPDCNLTVIVDKPIAVYSGMVPGFVAGQYSTKQLQIDARPLAAKANAKVILARALSVDPGRKEIEIQGGESIAYDLASFNIGSTVSGIDLPGVREFAIPTRPIDGFVQRVDELIANAKGMETDGSPFRIIVVGGGAGGVELAFTLDHRLKSETKLNVEVTIINNRPEILARYPKSMIRRVRKHAKMRQIAIRNDCGVAAARDGEVVLINGETIKCDALIWVTGPVSHPVFVESRLPVDDRGFVRVRSTLQFKEYDDLFAVGDCATFIDYPDTPKAGVYAVREGPIITANLRAALEGKPLTTYKPQGDFLMLMNMGDGSAIGAKWGFSFEGKWVMRWKDRIDRAFMRLFQIPPVV